jgi:hypothetical protein
MKWAMFIYYVSYVELFFGKMLGGPSFDHPVGWF